MSGVHTHRPYKETPPLVLERNHPSPVPPLLGKYLSTTLGVVLHSVLGVMQEPEETRFLPSWSYQTRHIPKTTQLDLR